MMDEFFVKPFAQNITQDKRTLEMFRYLTNNSYVRVVNYHNTRGCFAQRFEAEIKYFAKHFSPVTVSDMDEFFATRKWPKEKPGLIPAIFEGWRSNYDVISKILCKYGFTGWFYVPGYFMDVPVEKQAEYIPNHRLRLTSAPDYPDGRYAMNWDEMQDLAKRHVICCHTGSHFEITKDTSDEDMQREIVDAKIYMEQKIGKPVDVFCWLGGEEYSYNTRAHKFLKQAGYKYVVSNLKLEKIK
ncbi:MAG: polysaccharide deacetylase family protein [Oscillospiraceae bacterium]